jgi:uncharacterized membrane protein YhaH (DUF805 family)
MKLIASAIWNYAVFSGRARRKEYWLFYVFKLAAIVGSALFAAAVWGSEGAGVTAGLVVFLLLLVPSQAVAVRRLHDSDQSGWWIVVPPVRFFLMFFEGTYGPNQYGEDPRAADYVLRVDPY